MEYVDEHKDELEAENARRHTCAQHGLLGRVTSWPSFKAGWLSWLEQEPAALDKALQLAKSGARRAVNVRVTPRPDAPQKDPNVCLKPDTDTQRPAWACKLCNGWHALLLKDTGTRMFIFVVCCAGKFVGFAKPSVCVYQKNETPVASPQVLRQFVYKKRETVAGAHQLQPKFKAAVHVNRHNPSVSEQTLRCRQRRLERVSRFLCVFAWILLWLH
jgi:hypothetical protein